jgi:VanZ family protein
MADIEPHAEGKAAQINATVKRWLPPAAWMGLIFALSSQPDLPHAPGPWFDFLLKKAGHAIAFGILAWLLLRALRGENASSNRLRWISFVLAVAYACSDELHQAFVVGRNASPIDVLIDGVGAATAMVLHRRPSRRGATQR